MTGADRASPGVSEHRIVGAILLAAFAYSVLRAAHLAFTHDESLTYLVFVQGTFGGILRPTGPIASNNHLLNSVLMKCLAGAFGDAELVLRTPALLGHALYLAGVLRFVRRFLSGGLRLLGAGLLATCPFLQDLFSLARGYALGLGFSMLALSLILERATAPPEGEGRTGAAWTVALLTLAVLSNLSFAHVFCVLALLLLVVETVRARAQGAGGTGGALRTAVRRLAPALGTGSAVLLLVYAPIAGRITDTLYGHGGKRGFWADTVGSLIRCYLHDRPYRWLSPPLLQVGVAALLAAGAWRVARALRSRAPFPPSLLGLTIVEAALAGLAASMTLHFLLRGTPYGVNRSAVTFLPLFLCLLLLLAVELRGVRGGTGTGAAGVPALAATALIGLLLAHQLSCVTWSHVFLWREDADTKEAMQTVDRLIRSGPQRLRPRRLGITWQSEPSTNYYRLRYDVSIEKTNRDGADGDFHFYFLNTEDRPLIRKRNLAVLREFPVSGAVLALPSGSPYAR